MSIFEVRSGDIRLGWDSPIKEIVHPQYINLESRGGLGWLEGFNEWMVRCGLEFAGHPGVDEFISNTGDKAEMMLTVHGKIGNIPASELEVIVDEQPPHRIRIRGIVHERVFFGPKLELITELSSIPGSDSFQIVDTIVNHSTYDQEFQLIYHTNYAMPLLEKGAGFKTATRKVSPMNQHAAEQIDSYPLYKGPTAGFIEEVYLFEPLADESGNTSVLLHNAAGDLGTSISWSLTELPYLTVWKNTGAIEDGYVTGLEPATGYPYNRKVERKYGRVPKLAPGGSRSFTLTFEIHEGRNAVAEMAARIDNIQGSTNIELVREAPKIE
jgi:hypothetical protein